MFPFCTLWKRLLCHFWSILHHIPPENTRKPFEKVFWGFQGVLNERIGKKLFDFKSVKPLSFNPFKANVLILYSLKTLENLWFNFYTPWKRQKMPGFLTFSGGIEIENLLFFGQCFQIHLVETIKGKKWLFPAIWHFFSKRNCLWKLHFFSSYLHMIVKIFESL